MTNVLEKAKAILDKHMSVAISVMTYGHPLWDKTISFAENCSWKAGPYLAKMMPHIHPK